MLCMSFCFLLYNMFKYFYWMYIFCRHATYVASATHHIRQGLNTPARSCHSFETFQEVCEMVPNGPQCMFSDPIPVVHILYLLVICVPTTLIWDVVHWCCILVRQRVERRAQRSKDRNVDHRWHRLAGLSTGAWDLQKPPEPVWDTQQLFWSLGMV